MKFFKPSDFEVDFEHGKLGPTAAAETANDKLELELGNEYAIVNHFKAENEILWKAIEAAQNGLSDVEGGEARMVEREVSKVLEALDGKANNS